MCARLTRLRSCQAMSMGVHESQSLLWERMVALGRPFSRYLAPKLAAAFPQLSDKLSPDTLYGTSPGINPPPRCIHGVRKPHVCKHAVKLGPATYEGETVSGCMCMQPT